MEDMLSDKNQDAQWIVARFSEQMRYADEQVSVSRCRRYFGDHTYEACIYGEGRLDKITQVRNVVEQF